MSTPVIELVGRKFGRWTVLERRGKNASNKIMWLCRCDCGKESEVMGMKLRSGLAISCGCYNVEGHRTHGKCYTSIYNIWSGMKARCLNPQSVAYVHYGNRGITVCRRWVDSFENFYADMGERPSKAHSIDRIDNDKNYSCGHCADCKANGWTANCRWATATEQMNNTRRSKKNRK